jgi:hypothetical protein
VENEHADCHGAIALEEVENEHADATAQLPWRK